MKQRDVIYMGMEFNVLEFDPDYWQASRIHGNPPGFGKTPIEACHDCLNAEMTSELEPPLMYLSDLLNGAFDGCNSAVKQARLGGAANDINNWFNRCAHGKTSYLEGFVLICDVLDAFAECGYEVSTADVWEASNG